jgi:arginine/ornithine transport system substrate-binding protein
MNRRGLLAGMAVLAGLGASPASAQDKMPEIGTVRVAIEGAYPPFSERDGNNGFKGFDVDIAKALCQRMQTTCELVQRDWDQMQPALLGKQVDAVVASMSITIERKQKFDFTNRYYHTPARFVGRAGQKIEDWDAWLPGKRLGVQSGTVQERFVSVRFEGRNPVETFRTQGEGLKALAAGKIDLFLGDALSLSAGFLRLREGRGYAFVGPAYNDARWFGEGIGIAVRKEDQGLRWRLNRALDDIRADGTYERLSKQYFGFDIYGS